MSDKSEVLIPEVIIDNQLATIIKAEIDQSVSTAKAYPRSLTEFKNRAMSMATFSEEVAASCTYALPRGNKKIEGPSVRLAEIVCSAYGNIRSGARVIANDGKTITAQGICHDLETNNSATVEIKRSIMQHEYKNGQKTGKMITMNEDMQVVVGNAACAIAYRNAVFKVIPAAIIEDIHDSAKEVAKGTAATLVVRRDKAVNWFKEQGITDKQICEVLNLKKIEDIGLEELSTLTGMRTALKNNETTKDQLFSPNRVKNPEELNAKLRALIEEKKGKIAEGKMGRYMDIVENEEVESYAKMLLELQAL